MFSNLQNTIFTFEKLSRLYRAIGSCFSKVENVLFSFHGRHTVRRELEISKLTPDNDNKCDYTTGKRKVKFAKNKFYSTTDMLTKYKRKHNVS